MLALGAAGCAGATAQQSERARLRATVQELESASQTERRKMRDLEYTVARLTSKLDRSGAASESTVDDVTVDDVAVDDVGEAEELALPVEVLTPDVPDTLSAVLAGDPDAEEFEVVSGDGDDVEIVYVGEAAKDRSVQPDTRRLRASPPRPTTRVAARRPTNTRRRAGPLPRAGQLAGHLDRIPVTDDIGPTVARQLAAASRRPSVDSQRETPTAQTSVRVAEAPAPSRAPVDRPDSTDDDDKGSAKGESHSGDPIAEYSRYYRALKAGNHAFAITGFGNFIERYPRHSHADNARYWLAEAHYDQRNYRAALAEFGKVERDYPRGNKVPDALLKIGFCHLALGEREQARTRLAELTRRFPRSKPAKLATARLATLADAP